MMKKMQRILSIMMAMSLLLVACSGPSAEEKDAKQLITDYKKAMLEVKDYREIGIQEDSFYTDLESKIRTFFSEEGAQVLINREYAMYLAYAAKHKRNVELGEVELTSMKEKSDVFDYEYRIPVRVKDEAGELLGEHEYQGQVKLTKENGRFVIEKEWSRPIKAMLW
ncbi:hypothetical protein D3P07_18655 [Paenibacillus sp. 1011MAR3C5]|uniref:hypothetical protein n=1 Tax=Paenibacillus sp. 1011MAR3C5 TaxID=1675787 RepID=UPI000E6CB4FB|nr:hypothetical protein [Paenibacillus sp. 1011MAR3C5]RJE86106.1 hypothetical protein D3P07_18655 [Paenibacillus sp. 1011MAR3C5]